MPSEVRSPSDGARPGSRVGGRVVAIEATTIVIADAFTVLPLPRRAGVEARLGDLVIVAIDEDGAANALEIVGRDVRASGASGEADRLRARARGVRLARRAALVAEVRAFFEARGFLEVETPLAVPSPGLDLHLDAFALDAAEGAPRWLITSPEYQMKRLLAGGVPRLFQIARCFRRGEQGARHNPEFTMLEWYRAFAGVEAMIAETEALIAAVATAANGAAILHATTAGGARAIDVTPPLERLPIARAFARHGGIGEEQALALALSGDPDDEQRFFRILVDEVEPALAERAPVVLCDYPITQASLARRCEHDPRVAERFEIFVGGIELCNGFGELVDPREQRARLLADQAARRGAGLPVYPIDERFLAALQEGVPPSAGNALGLDRLVAMALGADEIGDVMSFPEGWL